LQSNLTLTLDPNTANTHLYLSKDKRKVTRRRQEQSYPDHPDQFEYFQQVLCAESLSGRCYWEVEWSGDGAEIGVTYKGIRRKGDNDDCVLGENDMSWNLICSGEMYCVRYNNKHTTIPIPPSNRVGVYVDWVSGTLSFYRVSSYELTLLYRFTSTFKEPLCPAFGVWCCNSSVSLCVLG
uniref:B30.2/SPRY domain-containing protein n=1 Tax=Scleropages formosus TaxID=113540 RepID=A0A8C9VNQ3_SCLFO